MANLTTHRVCRMALSLSLLVVATTSANAAPIQFGITDLGPFAGFGLDNNGHVIAQPVRNIVGGLDPGSHPVDYHDGLIQQVVDGAGDGKLLVVTYGSGSMSDAPRTYVYDPHPASGIGGPDYMLLAGAVGQGWTAGKDMNAKGDVVGAGEWGGVDGGRPFYNAAGTSSIYDLNDLIPANSGWKLNDAYSINDRGQILGQGIDPEGQHSDFLLTPVEQVPEPATWAVFGLAAAAFAWRKRRAG
ncbi:MAG: PEP-CTERM sorting domain-containing protein [Paludisphaera borealis]|uniref:PEP-CTERM sorting domain-containing protein n=1 Tax=Paludisphaera borealis TaxID=1387353 RepID=UPI002846C16D|nr:PEP-CTERM sorting domain-containing protein [Paludisphaera borealis]MDR3621368.1 PEP-CTERM sorting domain-containing protein [Paludisphaera borealis]